MHSYFLNGLIVPYSSAIWYFDKGKEENAIHQLRLCMYPDPDDSLLKDHTNTEEEEDISAKCTICSPWEKIPLPIYFWVSWKDMRISGTQKMEKSSLPDDLINISCGLFWSWHLASLDPHLLCGLCFYYSPSSFIRPLAFISPISLVTKKTLLACSGYFWWPFSPSYTENM